MSDPDQVAINSSSLWKPEGLCGHLHLFYWQGLLGSNSGPRSNSKGGNATKRASRSDQSQNLHSKNGTLRYRTDDVGWTSPRMLNPRWPESSGWKRSSFLFAREEWPPRAWRPQRNFTWDRHLPKWFLAFSRSWTITCRLKPITRVRIQRSPGGEAQGLLWEKTARRSEEGRSPAAQRL